MIKYTSKGQCYVERTNRDLIDLKQRPSFLNDTQIKHYYGTGMYLYFVYMRFIIVWNAIMGIVGIISWSIATSQSPKVGWTTMFVSNYTSETHLNWFITNCIIMGGWFIFGILYWLWETILADYSKAPNANEIIDYGSDLPSKHSRYYVGIIATILYLAFWTPMFYGLLIAQRHVSNFNENATINLLMGIPLSVSFIISNVLWDHISYVVTNYEKWKTWSSFRMSHALKLILFKIASTTIMYTLIPFVLNGVGECVIPSSATNFLIIVVVDTFLVMILLQTFGPIFLRFFLRKCFDKQLKLPEFNVSEHLLQLVYRQFILYIGFIIFPLIGLFGLISVCLQYGVDMIQLTKLTQDTHYIQQPIGVFLLLFSIVASTAALITYPNGALWMLFLSGKLPSSFNNCTILNV